MPAAHLSQRFPANFWQGSRGREHVVQVVHYDRPAHGRNAEPAQSQSTCISVIRAAAAAAWWGGQARTVEPQGVHVVLFC